MIYKIIKPPTPICVDKLFTVRVFLAGTIDMGEGEEWHSKVESFLANTNKGGKPFTVFNPKRDEWDSTWKQNYEAPHFNQQVNWELNALDKADVIFMYFGPGSKSPISLLELGLYADSGKMIVCCPDGFWRKGNVEVVCEKYDIPLFSDLQTAMNVLVAMGNKITKKLAH